MPTYDLQDHFDSLWAKDESGDDHRVRGAYGTPSDGQIEMWVAADSRKDWHTIVAGDIPSLDASKITTGTLAIARGGTNIGSYAKGDTLYASATNVLSKLAGATGHDGYLFTWNDTTGVPEWRADAGGGGGSSTLAGDTDVNISSPADRNLLIYHSSDSKWHNDMLVAGDIPSLDASKITTGTIATARLGSGSASSATFLRGDQSWATPGATSGGTGQTTWTLGDIIYSDATNSLAKLAGNTTTTKKFFRQTGTGSVSAAPAWDTLVAGDVPSLDASKITTGTLAVAQGGTNIGSYTTGDILYASSSSVLSKLAIGGAGKVLTVSSGLPAWADVSGSGGAGVLPPWVAYAADTAPASPNTEDDEFNSSTLDPKWTQSLTGSPTVNIDTTLRSHYFVDWTANSQSVIIYQSFAPGGDTSLSARVRLGATKAGTEIRIFFSDTAGTAVANGIACSVDNNAGTVRGKLVSRDSSVSTDRVTINLAGGVTDYILHVQRNTNLWSAWISTNGWGWQQIGTFSKTFTVAGIVAQIVGPSANFVTDRIGFDWIRRGWLTLA